MFKYAINELGFSGGETVEIEEDSLLILIGPNNCGKTETLRDISSYLARGEPGKVVKAVGVSSDGTQEELAAWLRDHFSIVILNGRPHYSTIGRDHSRAGGGIVGQDKLSAIAGDVQKLSSELSGFLIHQLDTRSRLALVEPAASIDIYQRGPQAYIHILQAEEDRLREISDEVRAAFGRDLIINWGRGQKVGFHVGDEPPRTRENDRVSREYVRAVNRLPTLESEGDGIISFVGCLLGVMCAGHKVLLVDEPEAFLHPPQAQRLGRLLAESAESLNRQIIIATHSSDVVRGAMSSPARVAVCRINRSGNENHAHILSSDRLRELWAKPLLKSSGAVAGVFHRGVVVCEADADCRFYESLLMRLEANGTFGQSADLHFVHGGGKGELVTLARSYKHLHVPVAVIADFDVLREEGDLKGLIDVFEGDFSVIEGQYKSAVSALSNRPPIKKVGKCVAELRQATADIERRGQITGGDRKRFDALLADARDWSEAKRYGINKLKGGKYRDCEQVLSAMKDIGLFIVPEGEMESWDRALPADKNEWIRNALNNINDDQASFREASAFMQEVASYLGVQETERG